MKKINFAYWGTPEISSQTLDILFKHGYVPTIIITSPDQRSGRGLHLVPTPVSLWAQSHNIKCFKPEKITKEFIDEFKKFDTHLSIVVAYGKILPTEIIQTPKFGTINIHYSLLPKYRGASPLESALLSGDTITGVSIQQMVFKLDSGPILAEKVIPIDINDTKDDLRKKLIEIGGNTLCDILPNIIDSNLSPKIQKEEDASFCTKIKKEDGLIDPNGDPKINYNKYRAFFGWPGVYFFIKKNDDQIRIKITKAKYENNSFVIERVIPEGKKETNYIDFSKSNTLK